MHGRGGCGSYVGRIDSLASSSEGQPVFLASSSTGTCVKKGIVQYESLHALGFWHEHSRPDRDDCIKINWSNVKEGFQDQFQVREKIDSLGSKYDYESVMHYRDDQFSTGVGKTIVPLSEGASIGQREALSTKDIIQVRLMYGCKFGPRTLSNYRKKVCTRKCKCSRFQWGCGKGSKGDQHFKCKGKLKYRSNRCLKV